MPNTNNIALEEENACLKDSLQEAQLVIKVLEASNRLAEYRLQKSMRVISQKDEVIASYEKQITELQKKDK